MKNSLLGFLLPLLLLPSLAACGESENEARLFLERYDRLDPVDVASRRALVEDLRAMPLSSEEVKRARDVCADLHESFLVAEAASAEARAALAEYQLLEATARSPEGAAEIEAAIERSQAAIERADSLKEGCLGRVERLKTRYAGRRR